MSRGLGDVYKRQTHYFTIKSNINTDKRDNSLSGRGKDVNNTAAGATQTGFCIKKYLTEERGISKGKSDTDFIIYRLGEIYLNLAEAAFELGDTDRIEEARIAVNEIRKRAGMPEHAFIDLEKIRHERRIELAFEGIRYWDLLRWKLAETVLVGEVWGAPYPKSTTYAGSTKFVDPTGHCRWYVGRRDFRNPQDYKWPIPLSEQNINPNLRE